MADNEKPLPEKDPETGRFVTGNIGGGRPKGSRAKLGEAFLDDMYADWQENGIAVIQAVRADKPDVYLKVVASILPKDVNLNVNTMDEMTDDQLIERIRALDATIRPFLDTQGAHGDSEGVGAQTAH